MTDWPFSSLCNGTWPYEPGEDPREFHVRDCPNDPDPPTTAGHVLALVEAEDRVARTLVAIDRARRTAKHQEALRPHFAADRERLRIALKGLRDALDGMDASTWRTGSFPRIYQTFERQARRWSEVIVITAGLYGVTP